MGLEIPVQIGSPAGPDQIFSCCSRWDDGTFRLDPPLPDVGSYALGIVSTGYIPVQGIGSGDLYGRKQGTSGRRKYEE